MARVSPPIVPPLRAAHEVQVSRRRQVGSHPHWHGIPNRELVRVPGPELPHARHAIQPHAAVRLRRRVLWRRRVPLRCRRVLCIKSKPEQIFKHLEAEGVLISLSTVQRMGDDALNLAAFNIDEKTREMLAADPHVLLGWDGEDPGEGGRATWLFLDMLKGRVLHTCVVDSIDYARLHDVLEAIRLKYDITYVGFVTDKQGLIVKCVQEFYPGIPHQYDQFHFLNNQWKHAVALDGNVYMTLRKVINGLYIHKVNRSVTAVFAGGERQPVREVFKPISNDLQVMIKVRNMTFEQLRGVWLYEKLLAYVAEMERLGGLLDPKARFTRIFKKTQGVLARALEGTRERYDEVRLLFDLFQPIREGLHDPERPVLDQQASLDDHYKTIWCSRWTRA